MSSAASSEKLHDLLQEMRRATASLGQSIQQKVELGSVPLPLVNDLPPSSDGTTALLHRLMLKVEAFFGIHRSPSVERKLAKIFAHTSPAALAQWVSDMERWDADHPEWRSLVENLTVHETYFGRDKPLLSMLRNELLARLIHQKQSEAFPKLRIWSAACSTGEEAYNIAWLTLEALLAAGQAVRQNDQIIPNPRWQIEILGTDISSQVLRTANAATYSDFGLGSFRDLPPDDKAYFETVQGDADAVPGAYYYRVIPSVRRWVRFARHNLMNDSTPGQQFDLILCRNVLIYFEDINRKHVQENLAGALAPNGMLVLGSTDTLQLTGFSRHFGAGGAWYTRS